VSVVYLGLGSNIGNRKENIERTINALEDNGVAIETVSSIIETDPIGPSQNKFLNAAAKATTTLSPENLLDTLKQIEKDLGRIKTIHHGPRTIDIDILFYDDIKINSKDLIIPHPEIFNRDFVMTPLKEIYPELAKRREVLQ